MAVLLAGAAYMVAESQLGAEQILEEIDGARAPLEKTASVRSEP